MKIAVIGSRSFKDYDLLKVTLDQYKIKLLISGGAKGADTLALKYAEEHDIPFKVFEPDWKAYQRAAGHHRNRQMVDACDFVLAFWDGVSRGTLQAINYAKSSGKSADVVEF
jgi:hypothetical protein